MQGEGFELKTACLIYLLLVNDVSAYKMLEDNLKIYEKPV